MSVSGTTPAVGLKVKGDNSAEDLANIETILSGSDNYSKNASATYILGLLEAIDHRSPVAYHLCSAIEGWLGEDLEDLGFPVAKKEKKAKKAKANRDQDDEDYDNESVYYKTRAVAKPNSVKKQDWDILKSYFAGELVQPDTAMEGNEVAVLDEPVILKNLMRLSERLGLSETEKAYLKFSYVASSDRNLRSIMRDFIERDQNTVGAGLALCLGMPSQYKTLSNIASNNGRLSKYGLIHSMGPETTLPEIDDGLIDDLSGGVLSDSEIISHILGVPVETDLDLEDFEYIGEELEYIIDIMRNAVEQGKSGVNILIYGPAGGGKTELVKAIAKALNKKVYSVGEEAENKTSSSPIYDDDGDIVDVVTHSESTQTDQKRLAQLLRTQALLDGNTEAFAFFDEIEDLLLKGTDSDKKADTSSKIVVNRLLENNPVPTIWAGNDPEKFHDAVRQRFTHSLYIGRPPVKVRKKIWEKQLALQGVELDQKDILRLARKYDAAPRQIAKAVEGAAITGKGIEAIEMSLPAAARINHGNSEAIFDHASVGEDFNPDLLNAKQEDASKLIDHLVERGEQRKPFALRVQGQQGTGISSMLRYIAEDMTMAPLEVSMYDLREPTDFTTPEQNIAIAFNKAADARRMLIINDIEATVSDPQKAKPWYEESLGRLFIQYAQQHRLPFAVTTKNASLELPPALTHVFSHHIDLLPLDSNKAVDSFKHFFGHDIKAEQLGDVKNLVLADFSNVSKLLERFDDQPDVDHLVQMLREQKAFRQSKDESRIGFQNQDAKEVSGYKKRQGFPFPVRG